jgi:hypothetical protein
MGEAQNPVGADLPAFPFFVGCGRSGTTLVRALFDSHPQLTIPGESRFIPALAAQRSSYEASGRFDVDRFVTDLARNEWFAQWGMPIETARAGVVERDARDFPAAVRALFAVCAAEAGKPRYGDKSPQYVMHLGLLARTFPEGRFVHIVRDGRDVALAYRAASFGSDDIPELALHWRLRVERGRRAARTLGTAYREVRYEHVVTRTEPVVRELCDYIDLDFDPVMLEYHRRTDEILRNDPSPGNHTRLALPPTRGLRDWRTEMSDDDVAAFELLAGDLLSELGYERSGIRPSMKARAAAARATVRWNTRRLHRKLTRSRVGAPAGDGRE